MAPLIALLYAFWPFLAQPGSTSTNPIKQEHVVEELLGVDAVHAQKQHFPNHEAVCLLPPEKGMCRGYMPMFYYDAAKGACLGFVYGGCGGNGNRFETLTECQDFCETKKETAPEATQHDSEPDTINPIDVKPKPLVDVDRTNVPPNRGMP